MSRAARSPAASSDFDGTRLTVARRLRGMSKATLAREIGVTPTAIAVAWITRHPANMQVVLGTTNPQRVADAAAGSEIPLTHAEWYELFRTAGHIVP